MSCIGKYRVLAYVVLGLKCVGLRGTIGGFRGIRVEEELESVWRLLPLKLSSRRFLRGRSALARDRTPSLAPSMPLARTIEVSKCGLLGCPEFWGFDLGLGVGSGDLGSRLRRSQSTSRKHTPRTLKVKAQATERPGVSLL